MPAPSQLLVIGTLAGGMSALAAQLGTPVPLTCPDCGGTLWQVNEGRVLRYRCHTGHAYTADALAESSQRALEETLWVALPMLEERNNLLGSMATHGEGQWSQ